MSLGRIDFGEQESRLRGETVGQSSNEYTFKVWSRTDLASAMFSDYVARHGEAGLEDLLRREQIVM